MGAGVVPFWWNGTEVHWVTGLAMFGRSGTEAIWSLARHDFTVLGMSLWHSSVKFSWGSLGH